jgi:probable phosphoglycerate mutase
MIYLCRHGRTRWNQELRLQGDLNSPLLKKSIYELSFLYKYICNCDIFYSSESQRAIDSAKISGIKNVVTSSYLNEIKHGDFEGKLASEAEHIYKKVPLDWDLRWPNGESYNDVKNRLITFLNTLENDKSTCIVAHEVVNKVILSILLKMNNYDAGKIKQPNNFIYLIQDNNVTAIDYLNGKEYHNMIFKTL